MDQPECIAGVSVVLWARAGVVCSATHRPDNTVEIHLARNGVRIDSSTFKDFAGASDYALTLMRSYQAA